MQIRSNQLKAGMRIRASYNKVNSGSGDYEFLGFTEHTFKYGEDAEGKVAPIAFISTKGLLAHYNVKSLKALEELQSANEYGFSSRMVVRDLESGEVGPWFYLFEGRWSRGSGAEPLSFELLVDATPPELIPAPKAPRAKPVAAVIDPSAKPRVKLVGEDGNVFNIIGLVARALKPSGKDQEFRQKAFAAHSYDEVLRLAMDYADVC